MHWGYNLQRTVARACQGIRMIAFGVKSWAKLVQTARVQRGRREADQMSAEDSAPAFSPQAGPNRGTAEDRSPVNGGASSVSNEARYWARL